MILRCGLILLLSALLRYYRGYCSCECYCSCEWCLNDTSHGHRVHLWAVPTCDPLSFLPRHALCRATARAQASSSSLIAIIAGAVGGALLLIAIIVAVVVVGRRRKAERRENPRAFDKWERNTGMFNVCPMPLLVPPPTLTPASLPLPNKEPPPFPILLPLPLLSPSNCSNYTYI